MRILAVTPYYTPEGGGLERYAHEILRRLAHRHDVHVLAAGTSPSPGVQEVEGVLVERHAPRLRLGNTPLDPALRRRVADHLRRHRPDVVWAHSPVPFPAEMAYLASRKAGVPFALTYHAGRLRGSNPLLGLAAALDRSTLERRMMAGAHGLVAVGPYVRDHALGRHRDRVQVIPPGVDTARFTPGPPAGRGDGQDILFVGPLDTSYRWKGLDTLLAALPAVRRRHPAARLVLVGKGDRVPELQARAAAEGLVLAGRLPEDALAEAYRSSAVACLPSTTDAESFGMVLAEANACGRPVVASRVGGIPDFVRHGDNGLLAAPGDAADLARRLNEILYRPGEARRMGQRGLERVRREHDWDQLADKTAAVLESASAATA
ncbi:MAG TPA: glycosyltransferase family 4 protein [Candidatus Thermoplasmatota archaeon]|nr:glycosyltransferase family 4 protein [Candidatus Thermoplasmatota archaeon]